MGAGPIERVIFSVLILPGEVERPGVKRAGEEADELFVVSASDPIEDAPVIFTKVYSPLRL